MIGLIASIITIIFTIYTLFFEKKEVKNEVSEVGNQGKQVIQPKDGAIVNINNYQGFKGDINPITIYYGEKNNDKENIFTINYMRAFGGTKVPLLMKYISGRKNSLIVSPEFEKVWNDRWGGKINPITKNFWGTIIDDQRNLEEYFKGIDENKIGFLFLVLENNSNDVFYLIEPSFYNIPNKRWKNLNETALNDNEISNKINNNQIEEIADYKVSFRRPGEALIWLLSVYVANSDGMPDYYLTDVQRPIKIKFTAKGKPIEQEIREPFGLSAARLPLPTDWIDIRAWEGQ